MEFLSFWLVTVISEETQSFFIFIRLSMEKCITIQDIKRVVDDISDVNYVKKKQTFCDF